MNDQNPVEEAQFVMDIYDYALTYNLNIESKDDVKAILEALEQKDVNEDRLEKLMIALQVTDQKIKADVAHRKKIN